MQITAEANKRRNMFGGYNSYTLYDATLQEHQIKRDASDVVVQATATGVRLSGSYILDIRFNAAEAAALTAAAAPLLLARIAQLEAQVQELTNGKR